MTKITVFLNGTKISELPLDSTKEYTVGRGSASDVVLESREISRQHAKIIFEGDTWVCKVVSRSGRILVNGNEVESLSLVHGSIFCIPPFEIRFESTSGTESAIESSMVLVSGVQEQDLSDKTQTGAINLRAVLFRLNSKGEAIEEIELGKGLIEAGRSRTCQIKLNDEKASRKHFKMENDGKKITLTHLGATGESLINEISVKSQVLQSSDVIRIGNEKFNFEYLNTSFENLPVLAPEVAPSVEAPAVIRYAPEQMPAVWGGQLPSTERSRPSRKKKNSSSPFVIMSLAILAVFIFLALNSTPVKEDPERKIASATKGKNTDGGMSDEQQKFMEDTYNLAMSLYTTGKYDLAALEIEKILRQAPNYKDAKNIQALCQQALEIRKQKDESDRQQREQEVLSRKVNDILDECDKVLGQNRFADVANCVGRVSEMDPGNARGQALISAADEEIEKKERSKEAVAERLRRKAYALSVFNKGQAELAGKRYPAAIEIFEKVGQLAFNDTEGIKQKAKLGVQSAKQKIVESSDELFREGKAALDSKDYKNAIYKLAAALKIYPQNGDAKISKEKAESELHIELKNIYSESVIDEDLGNIETAKKKWKLIVEKSTTFDTYFEKAKIKLRKYEK